MERMTPLWLVRLLAALCKKEGNCWWQMTPFFGDARTSRCTDLFDELDLLHLRLSSAGPYVPSYERKKKYRIVIDKSPVANDRTLRRLA